MTGLILKILDLFQGPFRLLGVDYFQMRALLWVKLTSDNRQEKSIARSSAKKEISNSMFRVMILYMFLGIFAGIMLGMMSSLFISMFFVFSMIMVMTAVALISDFTAVLLDTIDNAILLPRPVDGRTLAVARLVHIVIYLLMISFSLSAASLIIGTIKFGPVFLLVFPPMLCLSVIFVVFLSNVFYLLLIRISGEDRFRDIVLYFQILMAAFAMGSYQVLPRLIGIDQLKNFSFSIKWWTFLLPPAWMAAPIESAVLGKMDRSGLILTLLGIFVPLLSLWVVVRYLAPGFARTVARLGISSGTGTDSRKNGKQIRSLNTLFSRLLTSSPAESAVFKLVWDISSRDRKFKLKTYPTFGYMFIIGAVMMLYNDGKILEAIQSLPQTKKYLILLYLGCFVIPTVTLQLRFSDHFEASWIYYALPFSRPGDILKGGLKAVMVKYGISVFAVLSLLVWAVWGWQVWDDVLLALTAMVTGSTVLAIAWKKDFPFSRSYVLSKEVQKSAAQFLLLIVPAALGLGHYVLTFVPFGVPAGILLGFLAMAMALKLYGRVEWPAIASG